MSDDAAMAWLIERWLLADALRSVASGRLPAYGPDPDSLLPPELALDGYQLPLLFSADPTVAVAHVVDVQAAAAARDTAAILGRARLGPAPWDMDACDYAAELDQVGQMLATTVVAPDCDPGPGYWWAVERWAELCPDGLDLPADPFDALDALELIRVAAIAAGLLVCPDRSTAGLPPEAEAMGDRGDSVTASHAAGGRPTGPRYGVSPGRGALLVDRSTLLVPACRSVDDVQGHGGHRNNIGGGWGTAEAAGGAGRLVSRAADPEFLRRPAKFG
jgi:hypothetical protein